MASGDTLFRFIPQGAFFPASNPARPDQRNTHPVLDFDASTEQSCYWNDELPRNYAGGGVTVTVHFAATTATSGNVIFGGSIEATGTDLDSDSFAAEQSSSATACSGTSGIETTATITFTNGAQMDSLAVGNRFRFKLARKAADGSDTMTGDAEVTLVEGRES